VGAHGQMALRRALLLESPESVGSGFKSHPRSARVGRLERRLAVRRGLSVPPRSLLDPIGPPRYRGDVERLFGYGLGGIGLIIVVSSVVGQVFAIADGRPEPRWASPLESSEGPFCIE